MSTLVVGVGNPHRGDDAAGPAVADRLARAAPAGVTAVACRGGLLDALAEARTFDALIVVDAAAPAGRPGRIHRVDACDLAAAPPLRSTHASGVVEALGIAQTLGLLPAKVTIYAIEAERFEDLEPPSGPVAAAVDDVVARIVREFTTPATTTS